MLAYLVRRLLGAVTVVIGVVCLVFLLIHFIPGDPVEMMLGESATGADREALRKRGKLLYRDLDCAACHRRAAREQQASLHGAAEAAGIYIPHLCYHPDFKAKVALAAIKKEEAYPKGDAS